MSTTSFDLKHAASRGDLETVRSLIEAGADPNAADESGSGTLLSFHPAVTTFLLANGADPDIQTNENGASVLAGLCYVNQLECVKLILEHDANPNLGRKESHETPLHHAIANDASTELIAVLIQHGADVNRKTKPGVYSFNFFGDTPTRGETPLHRAAAYASIETVRLLLASGADRSATDSNGNTPYHWAGWHRRPEAPTARRTCRDSTRCGESLPNEGRSNPCTGALIHAATEIQAFRSCPVTAGVT